MTAGLLSSEIERGAAAILTRFEERTDPGALLVGISGIDGSGKGFVTERIVASLRNTDLRAVSIHVDGWLELPHVRFSKERPAERFYERGLRLDEMFEKLALPLKRERSIRLEADYTDETATSYRPHIYAYDNVDVIVVEGIFLFKKRFQELFDLRIWVDCSFETALKRAIARAQEGLPPEETIRAYERIYFPAQEIHFSRDNPREPAHVILDNDPGRVRD
jgi:uridine kinase